LIDPYDYDEQASGGLFSALAWVERIFWQFD